MGTGRGDSTSFNVWPPANSSGYVFVHDAGLARIYGNRYAGSVGYEYEGITHVCWTYLYPDAAGMDLRGERGDANPAEGGRDGDSPGPN